MRKHIIALLGTTLVVGLACAPEQGRQDGPERPPQAVRKVELKIKATPNRQRVTVKIDAVDDRGGHGTNAETRRPYPWEGIRKTPYTHTLHFQPGLALSIRVEAIIPAALTDDGDILACEVWDNGRKIDVASHVVKTRANYNARVLCIYTARG